MLLECDKAIRSHAKGGSVSVPVPLEPRIAAQSEPWSSVVGPPVQGAGFFLREINAGRQGPGRSPAKRDGRPSPSASDRAPWAGPATGPTTCLEGGLPPGRRCPLAAFPSRQELLMLAVSGACASLPPSAKESK